MLGVQMLKRCLLILVNVTALLVAALVAEIGIRAIYADVTSVNGGGYFSRRWTASVEENHLGYRERTFTPHAPDGTFRIVVIGDSLTYGQGVHVADRFTNRLERLLDEQGPDRDVLNFGRPGAETVDQVQMLAHAVEAARPHFVLHQWFVNDVEGRDKSTRPTPLPLVPHRDLDQALHERSALYSLSRIGWTNLQSTMGLVDRYDQYMRERFRDPAGVDARAAEEALKQIVSIAGARDIPIGIVLFPELRTLEAGAYGFDFLHERVLRFCADVQITCLDLREPMRRMVGRVRLMLNPFDTHPGKDAHRIAAEEIVRRFESSWRH
jgi:hypothetical protein